MLMELFGTETSKMFFSVITILLFSYLLSFLLVL